jgi:hypothetical protein
MQDDIVERPSDDALAVLALCEAAGDHAAADKVRVIIEDFALTAQAKADFFFELRRFFDGRLGHGERPLAVMIEFVNGPGRKHLMQGDQVAGLAVNTNDPEEYVHTLLALAIRDRVSRVLLTPTGAVLYRGTELYLVAPSAGPVYPFVFEYCRGMVGMAEGVNDIACTIRPDGSLLPATADGVHGRLQVVTDGHDYAVQVVLPVL